MSCYQNILCAVDFGDENLLVAMRAAEIARQNNAQCSLLHVVEYIPVDLANEMILPQQQEIESQLVVQAKKKLAELAGQLSPLQVAEIVTIGSTKSGIVEHAKANKVDLIIIGRHGRHGISRLLGSTANSILHYAPCDVLAVRISC